MYCETNLFGHSSNVIHVAIHTTAGAEKESGGIAIATSSHEEDNEPKSNGDAQVLHGSSRRIPSVDK